MKHIVMYSSGVASWCAAKLVADRYGTENLILLFADTGIEDEDNYRFLHEGARAIGVPVTIVKAEGDLTPWDAIDRAKFFNHRVAPCSKHLKQIPCRQFVEQFSPNDCILYLGIGWWEFDRSESIVKGWNPYQVEFPLCWDDNGWIDRPETFAMLKRADIEPPRLYRMGFAHANCGGFCIRAGKSQFQKLLEHFPDRYRQHEEREREFNKRINKKTTILREQYKKEYRYVTLANFRKRIESLPQQLDLFNDWGGCGCFSLSDED